jgi:hypothetical protein
VLRYFLRKLVVYALTFVVAVTVDWAIPHLMPGNPVLSLVSRIQVQDPKVAQQLYDHYMRAFNLDLPLWKQYWYFWVSLFHGDLGTSILQFPASVTSIVVHAGDPALLVCGQQGRRAGGAAEGAGQHGAAGELCADRDPVHVAGDPAGVRLRGDLHGVPGRLRL